MLIDLVLAACVMMLSYAMIPQIFYSVKYKEVKIAYQTLLINSIIIFIMGIIFLKLGLTLSFISNTITSLCWVILAILKFKYRR